MGAADRLVVHLFLYAGFAALAAAAACCSPGAAGADAAQLQQPREQLAAAVRVLLENGDAKSQPAAPQGGPLILEPLPYKYDALEPVISSKIMELHHNSHEAAYVSKGNAALQQLVQQSSGIDGNRPGNAFAGFKALAGSDSTLRTNMTLSEMLIQVGRGTLDSKTEEAIRNNGGGHWNHQLFWKVMAPPGSANSSRDNISPQLQQAISSAFGSVDEMLVKLKQAADSRFGSGWGWVCTSDGGALRVLSTPNQDNPLMAVVLPEPCVPILGLDVWEHAYYLQYGPNRSQYTTAWLTIVNWKEVSANYDAAVRGELSAIGTPY